jgi:hypothetical protein
MYTIRIHIIWQDIRKERSGDENENGKSAIRRNEWIGSTTTMNNSTNKSDERSRRRTE